MNAKKILVILGLVALSIHLFGSLPAYLDDGINGIGLGFFVSAAIVYFMEKSGRNKL